MKSLAPSILSSPLFLSSIPELLASPQPLCHPCQLRMRPLARARGAPFSSSPQWERLCPGQGCSPCTEDATGFSLLPKVREEADGRGKICPGSPSCEPSFPHRFALRELTLCPSCFPLPKRGQLLSASHCSGDRCFPLPGCPRGLRHVGTNPCSDAALPAGRWGHSCPPAASGASPDATELCLLCLWHRSGHFCATAGIRSDASPDGWGSAPSGSPGSSLWSLQLYQLLSSVLQGESGAAWPPYDRSHKAYPLRDPPIALSAEPTPPGFCSSASRPSARQPPRERAGMGLPWCCPLRSLAWARVGMAPSLELAGDPGQMLS